MSNFAVGAVYKRVIDAVIEASRNDFEENGVSTAVLESMQEKWQNRLSSSDRALFPWDPQPEPAQPLKIERNPERPSITSTYSPANNSNASGPSHIKQEPYDNSFLTLPPRAPPHAINSTYASQRAAHLMQQQFGSQANGSITALHATQTAQRQQQQPAYPSYPQQPPYATVQNNQAKQENLPQVKQETRDEKPNLGLAASQTDGAGDEPRDSETFLAHRSSHGEHEIMARLSIDQTIRTMIEQNAQRLEGGGLLVSLDERLPSQRRQLRKVPRRAEAVPASSTATAVPVASQPGHSPHFGGDMAGDDDDDDDEDAINSELDDPDETADTTQEGVYEGDVILCLYDKVQRVKNKWKCVLRDGIITIDGKDYIFHKANGEFEW